MNIHPTAFVAPGAVLVGDVSLGAEASVWYNAILRGDTAPITLGERTNIQDLSVLHADEGVPCSVGARVGVGHGAILHGCTVDDETLVGMGAVLLNGVRVGSGSVIGAGAVLPEGMRVPPGSLVLGIPGRVVGPVSAALQQRIRETWQHYVAAAQRHRSGEYPVYRETPGGPTD